MDDVLVLVQPQLTQNDIGDFVPSGPVSYTHLTLPTT